MKYETIMENQKLDLPKQNNQKQNKAKLMEGLQNQKYHISTRNKIKHA